MMAAGAGADEPQVIAPSSNDWDYTFDGGGDWPFAGNALGDGTSGGYVNNTGGDSAIYSLHTFDGDFEIEWTGTVNTRTCFGVHAIAEDDTRGALDKAGMDSMTNSFFYREQAVQDFFIGSSAQSDSNVFGAGSVIKFERISGVIKVYDDGAEVHQFSTTYSGTVRFAMAAPGAPYNLNFDNILFTDTEKVQRDGFLNEGNATIISWGDGIGSGRNIGGLWTPTRTGLLSQITLHTTDVASAVTSSHIEIQEHDGTNPSGKRGSSSNDLSVTGAGDMVYPFSTPIAVTKGEVIWFILVDDAGGSGDVNVRTHEAGLIPNGGAGKNDTLASITDSIAEEIRFEAVIDTSAGEPTPDHDTLLLIHSDTSDGSTTFVDSSQFGRTITVYGDAQHDTAQNLGFGASSILLDGTVDRLTVPHHADFERGTGDFTIECRIRRASSAFYGIIGKAAGAGTLWSQIVFQLYAESAGQIKFNLSNNGSAGFTITSSSTISNDTNYHIAVVRRSNIFNLYIDGVSVATTTSTNSMLVNTAPIIIGEVDTTATAGNWNGWIDEVRISRVARWDANFTPPTSAYP